MNSESENQSNDDEELTSKLAKDVHKHFPEVVRCYTDRLLRFATNHFGLREKEAEDVVQEVMMKAYIALKTYPEGRILQLKLNAWMYKITENEILKSLHKVDRKQQIEIGTDDLDFVLEQLMDDPSREPETVSIQKEDMQAFNRAFLKLSSNQQRVLILHFVFGMKLAEIAILLDQSESNIKTHIFRARNNLRKAADGF